MLNANESTEMRIMDLNERKMRILKSIIDEYIDKGEPVGSKRLVEYGNISLSPATIRNEMSELEEMGYLDKPHTSAGRIPSDAAYRIYVEKLMESYRLNVEELELLNELTKYKKDELDKLLERAGKVFSEITHCASLSLMRPTGNDSVARYDAMKIDDESFLLAMVLPDGSVKSEHIRTGVKIDENDIEAVKSALNKRLCSVSLSNVPLPEILGLERDFGRLSFLANTVVRKIYVSVCGESKDIKVEGISNLLSYPEFTDIDRVRGILNFIEERQDSIKEVLDSSETENLDQNAGKDDPQTKNHGGLKIYIGDENKIAGLSDASVVFCSLPVGDGKDAVIGILGPKRMDYRKVVSALRVFAHNLESGTQDTEKKLPEGNT